MAQILRRWLWCLFECCMCGTADKSTHAVSFLLEATRGIGRKNLVQEQLLSFLLFNFLSYLSQLALKKKEKEDIVISQNERALLDCSDAFCFVAKQGVKWLKPNWTEREIRMPVLNQDVVDPQQQQCGVGGNQVTHVIFDVDGTLLDTGPLYNKAITKVWNHHSLISALFVQTSRQ